MEVEEDRRVREGKEEVEEVKEEMDREVQVNRDYANGKKKGGDR